MDPGIRENVSAQLIDFAAKEMAGSDYRKRKTLSSC